MTGIGKWVQPDVPHRGWSCIEIYDDGEDGEELTRICEMCEVQAIRYVHVMSHSGYGTLEVGCICAGHMEQDYAAAKLRETKFKQRLARRERFLFRAGWQVSAAGNDYINVDGFNIAIFRKGAFWSGRIERRDSGETMFAKLRYQTREQAKLAAFDAMMEWKRRL